MHCPKCFEWALLSSGRQGSLPRYDCPFCGRFVLKSSVAEDPENFVFTTLEQVMATRTDCPTGPGGARLPR